MSEIVPATRQAVAAKTASRRGQVTGALKLACDAIVHEKLSWEEAADKAGLKRRTLRLALEKRHVSDYIKAEREVLLTAICAQNPKRLAEIRDQDDNRAAAVRAVSELEAMRSSIIPGRTLGQPTVPGLVIVINSGPAEVRPITIDGDDN
jgi:hypothetical protein